MKISIVPWDLSGNCVGRAYLLADVLSLDHEVELAGIRFGPDIWRPAADGRFACRTVPGHRWPLYLRSVRGLLRELDGDVIYALKPRPSSFGVALLHRLRTRRPVILDVDDLEGALSPLSSIVFRRFPILGDLVDPNGAAWTALTQPLARFADAVTVASESLRRRFGGVLVPHAKDTTRLRPRPEWCESAKGALGLTGSRVVMFLGSPRPWKGLYDAAEAMQRLRAPAVLAVVGVNEGDPYTRGLTAYPRVRLFAESPLASLPFLLSAADVVLIPQRATPVTQYQVPSKVFDAMALGKPIVATAVSDLPRLLGEGRGEIVPPEDPSALAGALDRLLASPDLAAAMGARAREWCEQHASYDRVRRTLTEVLAQVVGKRAAVGRERTSVEAQIRGTEGP